MNGNEEAGQLERAVLERQRRLPRPAGLDRARARQRRRSAAATASAWDGKLTALPFGGFEYSDRIYVVVEPGADYGHVLAWKQGLPEAWAHAMHEDGLTTVAHDLYAAFAVLHLDEDPLDAGRRLLHRPGAARLPRRAARGPRPVARPGRQAGRLLPPRHGRLAQRRWPKARWARTARCRASRCAMPSPPTTRRWSSELAAAGVRSTARCKAARSPPTWR